MQRLYDFIRRHPTGVDIFWAVVLLGLSGVSVVGDQGRGTPRLAAVPVVIGLCLVVALRRRAPEKMLLLAVAAGVAQLMLDVRPSVANFAMLVITFTVATVGERWASRLALVCSLCAAGLSQLRWPSETRGGWVQEVFVVVVMTVPFVLAWVLGDSMRTRRAYFVSWRSGPPGWSGSARRSRRSPWPPSGPVSPANCTTSSRTTSR